MTVLVGAAFGREPSVAPLFAGGVSKKGDSYGDAAMESWNHSLKGEAIQSERFVTREMVKAQVFEYIEVYYNRRRLHSRLGYPSPETFEARQMA